MKKLLLILLFTPLFFACGSDDEEDNIQYLDNKLIEGSWYWIDDSDSVVYSFENNRAIRIRFDKYTLNRHSELSLGTYKLTTERIIYSKGDKGQMYKLDKNTLFLKLGGDDSHYTPFIKTK